MYKFTRIIHVWYDMSCAERSLSKSVGRLPEPERRGCPSSPHAQRDKIMHRVSEFPQPSLVHQPR